MPFRLYICAQDFALMNEYHNPLLFYTSYKELKERYNLPFVPKSDEIVGDISERCTEREKEFEDVLKDTPYMSSASFHCLCRCSCCEPVPVRLYGVQIYVPCGKCVLCLRKRREMWSKRLVDETMHNRHFYAFGITLTYDSEHVPYLPVEDLKTGNYTYYWPNRSHGYLDVKRGCTPLSLATQENASLLCGRDLDLYFKRFRKRLAKKYPQFYARYFFAGEYGEIDDLEKVDPLKARTGRAHYHGIWFIGFKELDVKKIEEIKAKLENDVKAEIEKMALDCWEHCKQFFDAKKGIYVGKSIQVFGGNWGNYLGKYLNKQTTSQIKGCIGAFYVPERCWCSRTSPKLCLPALGVQGFRQSSDYNRVFSDLVTSYHLGLQFVPKYQENGFPKRFPKAYADFCIQLLFDVRLSRYTLYRTYCRASEQNLGKRDIRVVKNVRRIIQRSIYTPPRHHLNEIGDTEEISRAKLENFFTDTDEYLACTELYKWKQENNASYLRMYTNDMAKWSDIGLVYDDTGWHPFAIDENAYYSGIALRGKVVNKSKEVLKKALEYKHEHNFKNGYLAHLH